MIFYLYCLPLPLRSISEKRKLYKPFLRYYIMLERKNFLAVSGVIFALVALVHLYRAVMGFDAVIAGFSVPVWLSWVALIIAAFLSWNAFKLSGSKR